MKQLTVPHVLAYVGAAIVGALGWLASQSPSSFAFIGPKAVLYAGVAIGLAGALVTALHQVGVIPDLPAKTGSNVTTVAKVLIPLVLVLPLLHACTTAPKLIALPTLTTAQLQTLTKSVCATANADLVLIEGPTGKALLTPSALAKVTTTIEPTVTAVCNSGASVDLSDLQAFNDTVLPALIDVVSAVPSIPDQPEILAGLTLAQIALVPIVNQAIAAAQAATSSAPAPASSAPAAALSSPPTAAVVVPVQNRHFVLAAIESPQAVGGASAVLLVASLQAFTHVTVSSAAGAALAVLLSVGAAALDNFIG